MFDEKAEVRDGVAAALALFQQRRRGDTVTYAEMAAAAGFGRESSHWSRFIVRLRRDVRRAKGQTLAAVKNVGYRIETVDEQLHDRSIRRHRRAHRQMLAEGRELEALPDGELSDHQREVKVRKVDQSRDARRRVLYSLRVGHLLAKPSSSGVPQVR